MGIVNQKFHFIAIGGVGMSALAKYLKQKGAIVSGSDITESKYTHLLASMGINIHIGHDENLIDQNMIIVASSAIKETNPEIRKAKALGLKIWHRSDILKLVSDEFSAREESLFLGFAGTHGKTTTSGLCSYVLENANLNPSYVTGGIIPKLNTNANYNGYLYFCAELDESDGTLIKYSTDIAVINNMEEDHLDFYKNGFKDIEQTFNIFLSNKPNQTVLINIDNVGNKKFMQDNPNYNYVTFSTVDGDYVAKNIKFIGLESEFDVYYKNEKVNTIKLSIPGLHNVYNALAVYATLNEANVDMTQIIEHFYTFSGMGRRFQKVAEINGIKIYDDYAHHPSEIKTTLNSVKNDLSNNYRVVAIFQPHRYSRLQGLWEEFKIAFDAADLLIITDVYSAGETEIEGVNSNNFSKQISHKDSLYVNGAMEDCVKKIYPLLQNNDIVITLGAGNITQLGKLLETELKKA